MSAFEPTAELTAEERVAYERNSLQGERLAAFVLGILGMLLMQIWSVFDYVLERSWFNTFLSLRGTNTVLDICLLYWMWKTPSLNRVRVLSVVVMAMDGIFIAYMLPRVDHYPLYVLGFSLVFWASGVINTWPVVSALACYSTVLLAHVVSQFTSSGTRPLADFVGATFYLVSAAILLIGMTVVRRRMALRTFVLGHRLEKRNDELANALSQLKDAQARLVTSEKLSAIGRLLAGLSHEMNNPVNVIRNNLPPLKGYVADLTDGLRVARESVQKMPDGGQAFEKMWVDRELDFVSSDIVAAVKTIESGAARVQKVHADLRTFIRGDSPEMSVADPTQGLLATVEMMRRGLPKEVLIDIDLKPAPAIRHQSGQLNQVFLNLLQNAIDAVGPKGRIVVSSRVADGQVELSVTDDGPGVSDTAKKHLFEPFFTTKPVGEGTGLGLAISHEIIKAHGGSIALDLEHSPGACFRVRLPAVS